MQYTVCVLKSFQIYQIDQLSCSIYHYTNQLWIFKAHQYIWGRCGWWISAGHPAYDNDAPTCPHRAAVGPPSAAGPPPCNTWPAWESAPRFSLPRSMPGWDGCWSAGRRMCQRSDGSRAGSLCICRRSLPTLSSASLHSFPCCKKSLCTTFTKLTYPGTNASSRVSSFNSTFRGGMTKKFRRDAFILKSSKNNCGLNLQGKHQNQTRGIIKWIFEYYSGEPAWCRGVLGVFFFLPSNVQFHVRWQQRTCFKKTNRRTIQSYF